MVVSGDLRPLRRRPGSHANALEEGTSMTAPAARTSRLLAAAFAALLIVAACGSAAVADGPTASTTALSTPSASPIRAATPSPKLTPVPTADPQSPSPEPKPDTAADLKIGVPYKLVKNDTNTSLTASFAFDIGGQHIDATMNGREIRRDGALAGIVLAMKFSGFPMTREVFDGAAKGAANNTGGKLSFATILGNRVAFVTTTKFTFGLYTLGDAIVMVGATKSADTKALLTSVIKANK